MRVWLACIFVLFALAELFNWVQKFTLPLPVYILGGVFLAVVSNYDQIIGSYFTSTTSTQTTPEPPRLEAAAAINTILFPIPSSVENASEIKPD